MDNPPKKSGPAPTGTSAPVVAGPRFPAWLMAALLGLMTIAVFWPGLKGNFLYFDDAAILFKEAHVNSGLSWENLRWALLSTDYSYSFPLTRISHMLDFELFGADPWGHHLTNVLFHAANGVLLFLLLRKMTGAMWRSLIVAVLFAVHPLRVESVAWVSERKDVLSTFFCLLSLWAYARFAEEARVHGARTKLFYGLTLLLFTCGLMSKTMLVTFPFLLLLLDYWPLGRFTIYDSRFTNIQSFASLVTRHASLFLEKIPFFILAAAASVATYSAVKAVGGQYILHFPWSMRLETAVMGYGRYLGLMFWPANLSAIYPYPDFWPTGQLLCALAIFLGMSVLAFVWRRQRPYLLVGWLWYLGTLVPVIGLIPIGGESICTRFTYIPMMGALVLLVWGIDDLSRRWRRRAPVIGALVALATVACVAATRAEIVYWKDSVTLYNRAIAVTTNNFMVHYCLGEVLYANNNPDQSLAEFQKSVDINPGIAASQRSLATLLVIHGRYLEAAHHYKMAIWIEPGNNWDYNGLAACFLHLGRAGDAVAPMLKAAESDPQNAIYTDHLNTVLFSTGHETGVMGAFLKMVRSNPGGFGRYLDALLVNTNRVDMMNNLAWAFATNPDPQLRSGPFAVRLAKRACEITGYQVTVCVGTLAAAYAEAGRFDEAVSTAQLACSLAASANDKDLLRKNQELLERFRSHQSYHEAAQGISGQ